jgi:putative glutamine amidotransferase
VTDTAPSRRPTVGVTLGSDLPDHAGRIGLRARVLEALEAAGARVRLFAPIAHEPLTDEVFAELDGLLLPGGPDPHPSRWNEPVHPTTVIDERRDRLEYALLEGCLARGIPVLGICRGMQVINVALGGTLIQDLPHAPVDHRGPADRTILSHELIVEPGSRLHQALGRDRLRVNTGHHQAVGILGHRLAAVGRAEDGCVEALEWDGDDQWLAGVQYHPEDLYAADPAQLQIFSALVAQAAARRDG